MTDEVAARDRAIEAMLPLIPFLGWTRAALREAMGAEAAEGDILFPGGPAEMVAAFCDLGDRRMLEGADGLDLAALRTPARVRAVVALRLEQQRPHREAVRRGVAVLAVPANLATATACTWRTADTIWFASGDRSTRFDWYTKRVILSAVYSSVLLRWLSDTSEDDAETLAFLDRRLRDVGRIGRVRGGFAFPGRKGRGTVRPAGEAPAV